MLETIKIKHKGRIITAWRQDYIDAKTLALREFGYSKLTKEEVGEQLTKVLAGEELTIIGHFIKDDLPDEQGE